MPARPVCAIEAAAPAPRGQIRLIGRDAQQHRAVIVADERAPDVYERCEPPR